jgi:hypothetical protein
MWMEAREEEGIKRAKLGKLKINSAGCFLEDRETAACPPLVAKTNLLSLASEPTAPPELPLLALAYSTAGSWPIALLRPPCHQMAPNSTSSMHPMSNEWVVPFDGYHRLM